GVVLYEMIASRPPFAGPTVADLMAAILDREPPPLRQFTTELPAKLEWIVEKALVKDREERYQQVKELLLDLQRLKQRLEFEAELERSSRPDASGQAAVATHSGQTLEETAKAPAADAGSESGKEQLSSYSTA